MNRLHGRAPRLTTDLPRVSVVVPCYNYAHFLADCVSSALSQEGVEVDVTVVDDASTDTSLEVAHQLSSADPRVRVIAHGENRGHIETFNEALDLGTAPYVVKLDADDLLTPGSLRRSADVLDQHPKVTFVYGRAGWFQDEPPSTAQAARTSWRVKVWSGQDWLWRRVRGGDNVILQPEVMIRASALAVVGGHREDIPDASDFNLWLRLAAQGDVARIVGPLQGYYRLHPGSMQHTIHAGVLKNVGARLKAFDLFFEEHGDTLASGPAMRQRLNHTFAREIVVRALDTFDDGRSEGEPIEEYLLLAASLDAGIVRTLGWRELRHRLSVGRSVRTPSWMPTRLLRRARWHPRLRWLRRYRT